MLVDSLYGNSLYGKLSQFYGGDAAPFASLDQIICGQMNVAQTCAWLPCMDLRVVAVSCLMLLLQCCSCCFATLVQPGCFASLLFVCTVHLSHFAELLALPACMSEHLFAVLVRDMRITLKSYP